MKRRSCGLLFWIIALSVLQCGGAGDQAPIFPIAVDSGGPSVGPPQPGSSQIPATSSPGDPPVPEAPDCDPSPPPADPFRLLTTFPAGASADVGSNGEIVLSFNRLVDCATAPRGLNPLNAAGYNPSDAPLREGRGKNYPLASGTLTDQGVGLPEDYFALESGVRCTCNQIRIQPRHYLQPGTNYRIELPGDLRDQDGNTLDPTGHLVRTEQRDGQEITHLGVLDFKTADTCLANSTPGFLGVDGTPLSICSVVPRPGTRIAPDTRNFTITFNRPLACGKLSPYVLAYLPEQREFLFHMFRGIAVGAQGSAEQFVPGNYQCLDNKLLFQANVDLYAGTTYRFGFGGRISDLDTPAGGDSTFYPGIGLPDDQYSVSYKYLTFDPGDGHIDQGSEPVCPGRTETLDFSEGRWSVTPVSMIPDVLNPLENVTVEGIHTFWANEKLTLRVRGNCVARWYRLNILAKNHAGPVPDFYSDFNVTIRDVGANQPLGSILIGAADDRYHETGLLVLVPAGDSDFELLWTNDAFLSGVYDTNIQIKKAALEYERYIPE